MKLFKKLLPIANIASIATVVTPIVVSCADKNTLTWTKDKEYIPMEPKAARYHKNDNALTTAYHDDVKANLKIWSDDYLSWLDSSKEGGLMDFNKVSHTTKKISDMEKDEDLNIEFFRLDFNITIDGTLEQTYGDAGFKYVFKNRKITIKNYPLHCDYIRMAHNIEYGKVKIAGDERILKDDNQWSINMPEVIKIDDDSTEIKSTNKEYNAEVLAKIFVEDEFLVERIEDLLIVFCTCSSSNYYSLQIAGSGTQS